MTKAIITAALASLFLSSAALAVEFTYFLGGTTAITADENAVKFFGITKRGQVVISEDGTISGQGALVFTYLNPCKWQAPKPTDDYNCITLDVDDGAFTLTGEVLEWVHRHDDENPLKDVIFAYADAHSDTRPDYAPYRIALTITNTKATAEHLVVWGLSGGNVEQHTTGASALGMYVSGLFDTPFELIALPIEFKFLNNAVPHEHRFRGSYQAGTPIGAVGFFGLSLWAAAQETDPEVFERHWSLPAGSTEFSLDDLEAMEITQEDSRADAAEDILEGMQEMQETGIIPTEMWARMGDTFGVPTGSDNDPDVDPIMLEALGLIGNGN